MDICINYGKRVFFKSVSVIQRTNYANEPVAEKKSSANYSWYNVFNSLNYQRLIDFLTFLPCTVIIELKEVRYLSI